MHRADILKILLDYALVGSASLLDVSLEAADEADVIVSVNINFDIKKIIKLWVGEDQDALD